jgi:homeobox-leucine zipper protein
LEKQQLLTKNARLKDEFLRAFAIHSKIIRDSAFTQPAPWISSSSSSEADREALLRHAETSMEQFLVLATKGEPMWLPAADGGEMLNHVEYRAKFSPALFRLRPEGFAVEATRDTAMVWGSAAELVVIFMDMVPICSISSATHTSLGFSCVLDSLCVCLCCFVGSLVRDVPWGCGKCGSR